MCYATSFVIVQEGLHSPTSSTGEDTKSRPKSSKSYLHQRRITTAMTVKREAFSSSTSSEATKKKGGSCFNSQNKNKNKRTPTAVPLSILQPMASINRSEKSAGFRRLCFKERNQAKKCSNVPSQVRITIRHPRKNDKNSLPNKRN